MGGTLYRYSAFSAVPTGGNPAGIWVGGALPPDPEMQRIAAEVAYPETIFLAPAEDFERKVRYFSPAKEMDFCGHATVATGTGASALVEAPTRIVVLQGETMGRPSRLEVEIPATGGIVVSGTAVPVEDAA